MRRRLVAWLLVNVEAGEGAEGPPSPESGLHVGPASVCNLIVGKCWLLESKLSSVSSSSMNSRPAEGVGCVDGFWISAVSRCD